MGQVMEHRYFRLRKHDERGEPPAGGMVIRALVRARLIGLQLLTLEARVVVRPDDGDGRVLPPLVSVPRESRGAASPSAARRVGPPVAEPRIERAIELVGQSADTLERSRRLR
jgi:hypothetical protein